MNPDASLITALVERWRPETSNFHLPCGGVAIVRIVWLRVEFSHLLENASQEVIEQFARAYALSLIGGVLFSDRSGATVHLQYLLLIEDWQRAGRFAWGAAVLSYLYREMETRAQATEDASPRGLRWLSANSRQYGDQLFQYRLWFDAMDTVVWQPYLERALHLRGSVIQSETFRAVVPLICFSSMMWHHPDRVLRQFGMRQHEPHPEAEVRFFLRQATRGPSHGQQLVHASRESLAFWNRRH
ncbi:unnamed protein product, partial [Linum tenue]